MVWQPEIDELKNRQHLAEQMGGEEGVARQHSQGKLTVRERIAALVDPGSFKEIGSLAGGAKYDGDKLVTFTPAPSVAGLCTLNGRRVVVEGGDFTIRGGAGDTTHNIGSKKAYAEKLALDWRLPYVRLLDAVGGSVKTFEVIGRTYVPIGPSSDVTSHLLNFVPVVSAVMGSVAGLPAVEASGQPS